MNKPDSYSPETEAQDAEVTDFLNDLDIALGHGYQQPDRELFPLFSPQFHAFAASSELPLFERLALAYNALEESRRPDARLVVQKALVLCSRSPLGLRRSLVCVDLAHEIDAAFWSEALYSDLLLRPTDEGALAEWLWQLVRRWHKWNIKVVSTPRRWKTAIGTVAPKGIHELLSYFHAQNAGDDPGCWGQLCRIGRQRIDAEESALLDVGQDPDILKERIARLILPPETSDAAGSTANPDPSMAIKRLRATLRSDLKGLSPAGLKMEIDWLVAPWAMGPSSLQVAHD